RLYSATSRPALLTCPGLRDARHSAVIGAWSQCDELLRESLPRLRIERRPASVDPNVATALRPPEFLESVPECRHVGMWSRIVLGKAHQHADAPHELALLRVRCDRPRSHPTNQCNELARPLRHRRGSDKSHPSGSN